MTGKMYCFDPARYAERFAREGYVHIKQGATKEFYDQVVEQVRESLKTRTMKQYAIGDKQQAMYDFPTGANYEQECCDTISAVVGVDPGEMLMSERHVKHYDAGAAAEPLAHKDRYASQFSVGMSVDVKEGSTLVLYPYEENDINPFNTSGQMRASLSPDRYPEAALRKARRVEIKDEPRDIIIFRGHSMWHLRSNPALTTMLYLKMNAFHADPLGEDRNTPLFRNNTKTFAELSDACLANLKVRVGRRVDHFHRYYQRDWREVLGVVLFGEKHFTLDPDEWRMLQAADGRRTAGDLVRAAGATTEWAATLDKLRRLARRGVIDLVA
jgi:hypothetical protein